MPTDQQPHQQPHQQPQPQPHPQQKSGQQGGYAYAEMSNLVLRSDRRLADDGGKRPRQKEATGEPESLWGRIDTKTMGERAARDRPSVTVPVQPTLPKKRVQRDLITPRGPSSVLEAMQFQELAYRPTTNETWDVYALILHFVQQFLADQTQELLRSGADELIQILKNSELRDFDRKRHAEDILGAALTTDQFAQLVNLGKKIVDYHVSSSPDDTEDGAQADRLHDEGVAVVFDEAAIGSDDDQDGHLYQIDDGASDDEEQQSLATAQPSLEAEHVDGDNEEVVVSTSRAKSDGLLVPPSDVDAFWLQRTVSKYVPDAIQSMKLTEQIMHVLGASTSMRDCENSLVQLLNYDKFDLVKLLTKNMQVIYWYTRLAKAEPADRPSIQREMHQRGITLKSTAASGTTTNGMDVDARPAGEKSMAQKITERAPREVVDLDALAFTLGSHFMSNKKCILPEGSYKTTKKGYEEITIPAPKAPAFEANERLVPISELPPWAQPAFKGANSLNRVQSRVYPVAFKTDENMLLCAPTGAGKTNVAMLTVLHELGKHRDPETGSFNLDAFKIIYIAPMKALVQEMVANFSNRLTPAFGVRVAELTGDRQLTKQQISETQIIVTTPEKWDIITRKASDRSYTQLVRLIIIDEVHLLHDDRGPVLEGIIARTIRGIEKSQEHVRLVGLSATLPNYVDVATFMRVDKHVGLFHFDSSYRPCPLQQQYVGVTEKKALKRLQVMNEVTYEKCLAQAGNNQVLVFVHSRKETVKTAKMLRDRAIERETIGQFLRQDSASREILQGEAESVKSKELQDLLPYGFAVHHAGMTRGDRSLVEELFADKHIQVLVSTATLAWGVNLPAHAVIIKGTQIYSPERGQWTELSPQDVLQMLGRAGRPQYDTFGEGTIITAHGELQFYLSLLNTQLPIESQMVSRLPDLLNAEIVLGNVRNREDAAEWLGYTYLYVRMLRAPTIYGVSPEECEEDPYLDQKRVDLAHSAAVLLDKSHLIKYDRRTGRFQSTELGRIASYYYISHTSMATYNQHLRPSMNYVDLFRIFSLSEEFKFIPVREEEKLELQKLLERVPVPVKEGIEEPVAKVNVLLQSYISQLKLDGFALVSDMVYITQSAGRLLRAIFEICLRRGWAQLARKTLSMCQMVDRRMWSSMTPLRQFNGVSTDLLKRLEKKEFAWERMYDLNPQELGELVRNPKAGKLLHRLVHQFPKLELQAHVQPITRSVLKMDLTITPDFAYDAQTTETRGPIHNPGGELFWVFVEDCDGEKLLYVDQFILKPRYAEEDHHMTFTVPLYEPLPPNYFVSLISDRWLHAETKLPLSFKHLILPSKFPPHTELLDLQPLPITALRTKEFIELYSDRGWQFFNPIQTQCFNPLYMTDDNVFIGAPSGSGKTVCAELAILRLWAKAAKMEEDAGKIVFIAPFEDLCRERCTFWRNQFEVFDKEVVMLTGETSADLKLINQGDLIVATPEHWDAISRRWRQRRGVQAMSLFIVDETHLIGGTNGHVMELIISRTRFMATQLEKPIRIVSLSASLGNARDLGEWIGCGSQTSSSSTVFNFHPNVRPVPLEVHLQSSTNPHFASLMLALAKPVYLGISQYCCDEDDGSKQAIVFVPNRKQSQLSALELVGYSIIDPAGRRFLHFPDLSISPGSSPADVDELVRQAMGKYLDAISEPTLKRTLLYGIGYIHEGMSLRDKKIVLKMYQKRWIQVLLASREMCWGIYDPDTGDSINAHLSVIMNTQYYDGREHRYVDYTLAEVLKMCGKACKGDYADVHTADANEGAARVLLLCPQQKKEFYKKFLYEGLPVESHLDHYLHDHFNAEVVTRTIESKQDAVDYITWTYFYRRLAQNPNYYNLGGITHHHLSDHLSELVENTLNDLAGSKCIAIDENEADVSPLNLGMIAAYYYIHYLTIEIFSMSLTAGTKLRGLLEIICSAAEFSHIPIRLHEDAVLERLYDRCPVKLGSKPKMNDPHTKAIILLQSHFSRFQLPKDLTSDLNNLILRSIIPLIYACVDVLSSSGYLTPAMAAMELSQMIVQAMWGDRESTLRQLPFFDAERIDRAKKLGIETIFDLIEIEDESIRNQVLDGLSENQVAQVAEVANRFPNVDVSFGVSATGDDDADGEKSITVKTGDSVYVNIVLSREEEEDEEEDNEGPKPIGPVIAPFFPVPKDEGWWLVIGQPETKQLLSIKRLTFQHAYQCRLDFNAPDSPGTHRYKLYFMCDSWVGCDQEYEFVVTVEQGMEVDEEE